MPGTAQSQEGGRTLDGTDGRGRGESSAGGGVGHRVTFRPGPRGR